MNLDQIAGELRGIPDAALQQQSQNPGAVPGYLIADEIQRRQAARNAPQQQGNNNQPKPTILSILGSNLAPPQAPMTKSVPALPLPAVPPRNLANQPAHFAGGGENRTFDPTDLYGMAGDGSQSVYDSTEAPITSETPPDAPPVGSRPQSVPVWSEKAPVGVNVNSPGAYNATNSSAPAIPNYPQSSTSPLSNPPNTHAGGHGFFQTLAQLAPVLQYAGNIGAGAAQPHGNFASGVGYANQVLNQQQQQKELQAERAQEMALRQQQMGMEGQKLQMEGLMSGAKFVGPDGKVQEAPVNAPAANINGVPMGGAPIIGSGAVPSNPGMTLNTAGRQMDYSDIMTPQKQIELQKQAKEEEAQLRLQESAALKQQTWIAAPKELTQYMPGVKENQMVPPTMIEQAIKLAHPAVIPFNKTDENGNVTVGYFDPNATSPDKQVVMKTVPGLAPSKNDLTAYQEAQLGIERQRLNLEAQKANKPNDNEMDKLISRYAKPYETSNAAAQNQLDKISDARAMINGNAESQALGIPKILTALVSGQGSGVRITQAELNAIAKARGIGGDVEGFFNKISGQGTLTDQQKQQMTGILNDVESRLKQKQAIANEAIDKINGSSSRDEVLANESTYRNKLNSFETQHAGNAPAVGEVRKGYRFNGGDPSNPSSWSKVTQ